MSVDYVTTKGPNPKLKKKNQEEFKQIKKEEIIPLNVKEEGNQDIDKGDIYEEDIDEEDSKKWQTDIEVKEVNKIKKLEQQDSHEWAWSEPFTVTSL